MKEFLIFKFFISSYVLVAFYYIGAVFIPFISWIIFFKYLRKTSLYKNAKSNFNYLPLRYKILFSTLFILMFICMEICWRVMIEFLLAYIQIRDVLVK